CELRGLVLAATARQHFEHGVIALRPLALAAEHGELELGEVFARGVARQVARTERERLIIEQVHAALPGSPPTRTHQTVWHSCRGPFARPLARLESSVAVEAVPERLAREDGAAAEHEVVGYPLGTRRVEAVDDPGGVARLTVRAGLGATLASGHRSGRQDDVVGDRLE